jgi:hypothetical protein
MMMETKMEDPIKDHRAVLRVEAVEDPQPKINNCPYIV